MKLFGNQIESNSKAVSAFVAAENTLALDLSAVNASLVETEQKLRDKYVELGNLNVLKDTKDALIRAVQEGQTSVKCLDLTYDDFRDPALDWNSRQEGVLIGFAGFLQTFLGAEVVASDAVACSENTRIESSLVISWTSEHLATHRIERLNARNIEEAISRIAADINETELIRVELADRQAALESTLEEMRNLVHEATEEKGFWTMLSEAARAIVAAVSNGDDSVECVRLSRDDFSYPPMSFNCSQDRFLNGAARRVREVLVATGLRISFTADEPDCSFLINLKPDNSNLDWLAGLGAVV